MNKKEVLELKRRFKKEIDDAVTLLDSDGIDAVQKDRHHIIVLSVRW